jgi:HlyD family secretion protein
MKVRVTPIVVVVLCIAAAVWAARRFLRPEPVPVRVFVVERGLVEASVANTKAGTVLARRRASVSPQIGGSVVELGKREGEAVKQGDLLLRLDDAAQRAELAMAERAADVAVAVHERSCIAAQRALQQLTRQRELGAQKIVSVDVVDEAQSAYDLGVASCKVSDTEIARARAAVDVARAALDMTIVRAPFDGIVADLDVEVGEWITPAPPLIQMPTLVDLIDTSSLYISAPMDEVDSGHIRVGQLAKVTLDPFPGRSWEGRVSRIAPFVQDVEAQNRTVDVEVELDDREFAARLLPGTSADVEIVLEERRDVLRVPTNAVIEGGRALVLQDGTLVEKQLAVGLRNWQYTEVVSGLEAGEQVVVSLDQVEVVAGAPAVVEGTRPGS